MIPENRRCRCLVITPRILLCLIRRFSVEPVPEDAAIIDVNVSHGVIGGGPARYLEPTEIAIVLRSDEFDIVPKNEHPPKWSPVLDITTDKVEEAVDHIKAALDTMIDSDIEGWDKQELTGRLGDAVALLTKHIETGGKNGKT